MTDKVPDLLVEKLALGELSDAEAAEVTAQLGDDEHAERLATIEASNAEILREHPPSQVAARVQRKLDALDDAEHAPKLVGWGTMLAAAVAAVLLTWWLIPEEPQVTDGGTIIAQAIPPPTSDTKETVYLKGDPQLIVERVADNRAERLAPAQTVAAGDLLQVSYRAAGASHGVIVSIDGAGVATLHFPTDASAPASLDQGGRIPLSNSYELDDAPGFERFFFVTATDDTPIDVAKVLDAAQLLARGSAARSDPLALPAGLRQQSLHLTK